MKKNIKKCFALLLAVVMTLTMAMTVFAENATTEEYTLKITNQNEYDAAVEYAVYQLFLCNLDANNVPSYTATGAFNETLISGKTVEDVAGMTSEKLYQLVVAKIRTKDVQAYMTLTTGTELTVPAGYYLVVPTNLADTKDTDSDSLNNEGGTVSAPILVAVPKVTQKPDGSYKVENEVEVTAKSSKTSHEKKITDVISLYGTNDTFSTSKDTATSGVGDTIEYTITNTVPEYKSDVDLTEVNYFVTDEYDEKLTLSTDENTGDYAITVTSPASLRKGEVINKERLVTAKNGNARKVARVEDGDYYVEKDGNKFIVYFNFDKIKELNATQVVIKAKFTLNNDATPGTDVVNNSKLTYTNNYYTGTDSDLEDQVKSYTFKFNVYKYDTKKETPLGGATFGLYKDQACTEANKIAEVTSSKTNGVVDFGKLLNEGTYYVKEITAPNGYRVDDHVYTVVITGTKVNGEYNGTYTVNVDGNVITNTVEVDNKIIYTGNIPVLGIGNTPGLTLPGTGGIGTTLFTFGGIALILIAGVMFIVYTRKQKKQS